MAQSRFMRGLKWLKKAAIHTHRALPGAAKVAAMMGNGVFIADKCAGWILRTKDGLSTPLGIILAITFSAGAAIDNIIGRAFAMYRQENSTDIPTIQSPTEAQTTDPKPSDIARNATCCYPGIDPGSCTKDIAYKLLQIFNLLYMTNSGMGGFLSGFSLAQLVAKTPGLEFDSTCDASHSSYAVISITHIAALYLAYSSMLAFLKSNRVRMRESFVEWIIQGHWREFGALTYLETFSSVSINTIGIIFSNKHTLELLEKNSLCHLNASLPTEFIQTQSWEAALSNVATTSANMLPPIHKRRINRTKKELNELLEDVPEFKPWKYIIQVGIALSALGTAIGSVVATAKLPESINPDLQDTDISYQWWMIGLAVIAGFLTLRSQHATSTESYLQELEARKKINRVISNTNLQALLLDGSQEDQPPLTLTVDSMTNQSDDNVPDITMLANSADHIVPNASPFGAIVIHSTDRLSTSPSATLFGATNPANPNAVGIQKEPAIRQQLAGKFSL